MIRTAFRPADAQMLEAKRFSRDEMMQALWAAGTASRAPVISNAKPSRTPPRG